MNNSITTLQQAGEYMTSIGIVTNAYLVSGEDLIDVCGFSTVGGKAKQVLEYQIKKHGFRNDVDFTTSVVTRGRHKVTLFSFSLNSANHILLAAMTAKGKVARQDAIDTKIESQPQFVIPQTFGEALQLAADQTVALEATEAQLQLTNERLEATNNKVIEQAPKANYYDKVIECEGLTTATQIAIKLGTTANKLNKFLVEQGNVYDGRSSKKVFVSGFVQHGYGRMVTSMYKDRSVSSCKFTPKGEALLVRLYVSDVEQIVRNDPFAKFMK